MRIEFKRQVKTCRLTSLSPGTLFQLLGDRDIYMKVNFHKQAPYNRMPVCAIDLDTGLSVDVCATGDPLVVRVEARLVIESPVWEG